MKKWSALDEMEKNVRMQSERLAYKTALLGLAGWSLFETIMRQFFEWPTQNSIQQGMPHYIFIIVLCVQMFSEQRLKRKMTEGEPDFKQPDDPLMQLSLIFAITVVVLSIGLSIFVKVG
jgi:membrane protein insertase Oxa1/YidC/SpoIIIJ